MTTCPPYDWRTPPLIDAYNEVLVELTAVVAVEFIGVPSILPRMIMLNLLVAAAVAAVVAKKKATSS